MKTYLDCLPCFMQQALRAGRMATNDEKKLKDLLSSVGEMIKDIPMQNTPPETGDAIYKKVREITRVNDPYKEIKKQNIAEAIALYPEMKKIIDSSDDKILTAIRFAIAGNVVDFGVNKEFDIEQEIKNNLDKEFAIFDYQEFIQQLEKANSILYIGDNAGESVFDKILIEELGKKVTFVVRDIPVINDATKEDAIASGIGEVAEIISSGTSAPGTILNLCNDDFLERFKNADLVISKGQGNYEGLSNVNRTVFFLLKAKCPIIANDIGVKENDIVLKGINI